MKHAYITGATGFLGQNLVEQLRSMEWRVTALHRRTSDIRSLQRFDVECVEGDILDAGSIASGMPDNVDVVFHVAGNTSIWRRHAAVQTRDNVDGTAAVIEAATRRRAKRFVYTSSWVTFGLEHAEIDESTPQTGHRAPDNYSRSKYAAEQNVLASGLDAVVLNPAHVLGRYDRGNWSRLVTMVDRGTLPGIPPGAGSFCHAEQVALAHIAAAERGRSGERYLLGGADETFVEVIRLVGKKLQKPVSARPVPASVFMAVAWLKSVLASLTGQEPDVTPDGARMVLQHPRVISSRAQDELGYRYVSLDAMLDDAIGWMRSEGLVSSPRPKSG